MNPIREIAVFEPDLRTVGSHHFEFVQRLHAAATRAGVSIQVFGHREAAPEVVHQTHAEPLFSDRPGWQVQLAALWPLRCLPPVRSWLVNFLDGRRVARELFHAFRQPGWEGRLVLVPNCHQVLAAALGRTLPGWLRAHPRAGVVAVFPFVPGRHLFLRSFRLLVPLVRTGRVALATDSEPLAELYRRLTGFPFVVLPMPYGVDEPPAPTDALPVRRAGTRFLACGGYRMEKGVDLLAGLIESVEMDIVAGAMSFVLQGFSNDSSPEPEAARHFERIKAVAARCPPGGLSIIDSVLSTTDYHRLFARCDAAILPYRQGPYAVRTSGVLTECVARGKPVVATADTWPGIQIQARGAGLVFPDGDVNALVRAVRLLNAELPRFAADALARRTGWLAFHNPDNYLHTVVELARKPASRSGPTPQSGTNRR